MPRRLNVCFLKLLWLGLVAGAYVTALAIAHSGFSYLAWLSLLPLFITVRVLRPTRAAAAGAIWGVCLYLWSTTLVTGAITPSAANLVLLTLTPSAYVGLGSLFTRQYGFSPMAMGIGWIALELALQPLGLGHSLLARATDALPLAHNLGYGMVAFLVAYAVALLLVLSELVRRITRPIRLFKNPPARPELCLITVRAFRQTGYLRPSQPRAPPCPSHSF